MNIETAIRIGDISRFAELFYAEKDNAPYLLKLALESKQKVITSYLQVYMRENQMAEQCDKLQNQAKNQDKYQKKKRYMPKHEPSAEDADAKLSEEIEAERNRATQIEKRYRHFVSTMQAVSLLLAVFFVLLAVLDVWLPK